MLYIWHSGCIMKPAQKWYFWSFLCPKIAFFVIFAQMWPKMIPKESFPTADRRQPAADRRPPTAEEIWVRSLSRENLKKLCVLLNSFRITQVKFRFAYPRRELDSSSWLWSDIKRYHQRYPRFKIRREAPEKFFIKEIIDKKKFAKSTDRREPTVDLRELTFESRPPKVIGPTRPPTADGRPPTADRRPPTSRFLRKDFLGLGFGRST